MLVRGVGEGEKHLIDVGSASCLDPDPPYRFLNHSCRPNSELVMNSVRVNQPVEVVVVALQKIQAGDELLIDYAWDAEVAEPCYCGENECRGWIVSKRDASRLLRNRAASRRSVNTTA